MDLHRPCRGALVAVLSLVLFLSVSTAGARAAGDTVEAWGNNVYGSIGDGTTNQADSPVTVNGLSGLTAAAAGANHSLALLGDGTVEAWGNNAYGQLGIGNTSPDSCAGSTPCSKTPVAVNGLSGVVALASGDFHSLALLSNGTVMAWGLNNDGQLGDQTTTNRSSPVPVSGLSDVVAIAAGGFHSLALLSNGTVMAWGQNSNGELGTGSSSGPDVCGSIACSTTPVPVSGLSGVMAIAGGFTDAHSVALLSNGTVMSWGQNSNGELGLGTTTGPGTCASAAPCATTPTSVAGPTGVTAVGAGASTSQVLLSNGTVMDWGWNVHGQLGDGTVASSGCFCTASPVTVSGLSGIVALAGGDNQTVALTSSGGVQAWGMNSQGELGIGNHTGPDTCNGDPCSKVPVAVSGLSSATDVASGFFHNLALVGPSQALNVSLAGAGKGEVGGQGLLCPPSCSRRYPQGAQVSLMAQPAAGTGFAGFSGACTGTAACRVGLGGDQTVIATFGRPKGTRITRAKVNRRRGSARFSFNAPGAITGFQCALVRPKRRHHPKPKARFSKCAAPKRYRHLAGGRYTFRVRALDILGADAAPATKRFSIKR